MSFSSFNCSACFSCLAGSDPATFHLYAFSGSDDATLARLPSVDRLDPNLTINGISKTPEFLYKGRNATSASWTATYGSNLAVAGTGNTISASAGSPLLGANDNAVKFNRGKRLAGSGGQIGTEDAVFEAVVMNPGFVTTEIICGTKDVALGWDFRQDTSARYLLLFTDATGTTYAQSTNVVANGVWFHVLCFLDRDGSGAFYINGVEAGTRDISTRTGSLESGGDFSIGGAPNGTVLSPHHVAYCAMWKQDNWLDTHLQATIAADRFQRLTGHYPYKAKGTTAPTVATRASAGYLDKVNPSTGNREYYYVGANWMRCVDRPRSGSYATGSDILNAHRIKGALIEQTVTNLCLQSEDFSTTWTATRASVATNAAVAPNGATTADTIHEDATAASTHFITQVVTIADATVYTFSCWLKPVNRTWAYLTANGKYVYFELSGNGTVGTESGATGRIEHWGNDWYRCSMTFTSTSTAGTPTIAIGEGDNVGTFDGLNQDAYYLWGAQVEAGPKATSYIPTTTTAVARNADVLYFKGDDGNVSSAGAGSISFDILNGSYDNNQSKIAIGLSDGGSSGDRITFYGCLASDVCQIESAAAAGSAGAVGGATPVSDGAIHTLKTTYQTDELNLYVDGTQDGAEDTSVDPPDELDRIHIGSYVSNTLQANAVLSEIKITNDPRVSYTDDLTFRVFAFDNFAEENALPSVDRLNPKLMINGITVTPTFLYKGRNAETSIISSSYGPNLNVVGSGAPISASQSSPLLDSGDQTFQLNGGVLYQDPNTGNNQIATEDVVIELFFKIKTLATQIICGTLTSGVGWDIRQNAAGQVGMILKDAGGNTTAQSAVSAVPVGAWVHAIGFGDRDGSFQWYVNGVASGASTNISAYAGTLTNSNNFTIGATPSQTFKFDGSIAYIAMWKRSSWLDTHLQANVAKERYARLSGHYPQHALGTKLPTVATRATTATLDKVESDGTRRLYQVGSHWMRCVDRPRSGSYATDAAISNAERIKGALIETSATNLILSSSQFDGASWTLVDAGDSVTANAINGLDGALTADALVPDTTNGVHGWTCPATLTNATYTFSCWAKAGSVEWMTLQDLTQTNAYGQFKLSGSGQLGTAGSGCSRQAITPYGNGWYRCEMSFTGIVGLNSMRILAQAANNGFVMTGDGSTIAMYFWGAQVELGAFATSYIPTTTTTAARSADVLYYKGDDGNVNTANKGSLSADMLFSNATDPNAYIATLNDGGSISDRIGILLGINTTWGFIASTEDGTVASIEPTEDSSDGQINTVKLTYQINEAKLYKNGSQIGSTDTDVASIPNDLDRINIGSNAGDTFQLNGVISDVRIRTIKLKEE